MNNKQITASEIGIPNCYKYFRDGWSIIHLEGDPFTRGKGYGYLIANEMAAIRNMLVNTTPIFYGHEWEYFVNKTTEIYGGTIPDEYKRELEGIVIGMSKIGSNWSYAELLAWNCQISIQDYWWRITQLGKCNETERCSSFIATGDATADGKIIMAHNTWDAYYNGQWCNCIVELVPDVGNTILMQTFYGYISSLTDFFTTSAGIIGCDTTIGSFNVWKPGVPCFVRLRNALQYANSLTSFTKYLLKDNGGDYANTWYLGDINTNEIMKFDLGLNYHSIKTKKNGYFIGFNEAETNKIRNLECERQNIFNIKSSSGARRVRLRQLLEKYKGELNIKIAQQIISDQYDVFTKKNQPGSRTIEARYDLDNEGSYLRPPNYPHGTVDAKIISSDLASNMSFLARWGSSSGLEFNKDTYCDENPQWGFLREYLKNRPTQPWTIIN